jgi:hypothetical protein
MTLRCQLVQASFTKLKEEEVPDFSVNIKFKLRAGFF